MPIVCSQGTFRACRPTGEQPRTWRFQNIHYHGRATPWGHSVAAFVYQGGSVMSFKSSTLWKPKKIIEMGILACPHGSHRDQHSILYKLVLMGRVGVAIMKQIWILHFVWFLPRDTLLLFVRGEGYRGCGGSKVDSKRTFDTKSCTTQKSYLIPHQPSPKYTGPKKWPSWPSHCLYMTMVNLHHTGIWLFLANNGLGEPSIAQDMAFVEKITNESSWLKPLLTFPCRNFPWDISLHAAKLISLVHCAKMTFFAI